MRRVPPVAYPSTDALAPYRDGAAGQYPGSWPGAEFFNAVLAELCHLIEYSGQTLAVGDLQQVRKAIGLMIAAGGAGGTTVTGGDFRVVTAGPLTAPPGSPTAGQVYLVGSPATGYFAGKDYQLATRGESAWTFSEQLVGRVFRIAGTTTYYQRAAGGWSSWTLPISIIENLAAELAAKSDVGHTHDYLPLAGGTLTGPITAPSTSSFGGVSSDTSIKVNNGGADTGSGAVLFYEAFTATVAGYYAAIRTGPNSAREQAVYVGADGRVRIGSGSSPAEKLDVGGNIALSGALKLASGFGTANQVPVSAAGGANTWSNVIDLVSATQLRAKIGGQTVWATANCWGAKPSNGTVPANLRTRGCTVTTNEFSSGNPVMIVTFTTAAPDTSYIVVPDGGAVSAKTVNGFTLALGNLTTSAPVITVYL